MDRLSRFFGWLFVVVGIVSIAMALIPKEGRTSQEVLGIVLIVFGYIVLTIDKDEHSRKI